MAGLLAGRVAVVTGAAQGIGRATALRLAAEGAELALLDLEAGALQATATEVAATGRRALALGIDCTDAEQVTAAFAQVRQELGDVAVLVNNVGRSGRARMGEFRWSSLDSLEDLLSVNLRSCVLCTRAAVTDMQRQRWGRVVNLTSEAAVNGVLRNWDYAAAKAGVIGFTRALARELAPFGITVNAVGPGATRTRAMEQMPADLLQQVVAGIPMGRMGEPEEVADVIAFFASGQSSYVTGQTLLVNGGNWFL
jgi:NAD(P)-dependent dehydrogenase (short-subunit alcohol dehydrogenase family)